LCFCFCFLLAPSVISAQALTWVSGIGDDANPCTRTAPCKTLAGAISKTVDGGQINALDPGGFGAVTITKSITIDGGSWVSSVLVSGTNGIVVSGTGITVTIRNFKLNGLGGVVNAGLSGIDILTASTVYIDNVSINGFSVAGINIAVPSAATQVYITNTRIQDSVAGVVQGTNGTTSNQLQVSLDHCSIVQCIDSGVLLFSGQAALSNSAISQNPTQGVYIGASVLADLQNNQVTGNGVGLQVGQTATARVTGNLFAANTVDMECESQLTVNSGNILSNNNLPASC